MHKSIYKERRHFGYRLAKFSENRSTNVPPEDVSALQLLTAQAPGGTAIFVVLGLYATGEMLKLFLLLVVVSFVYKTGI